MKAIKLTCHNYLIHLNNKTKTDKILIYHRKKGYKPRNVNYYPNIATNNG